MIDTLVSWVLIILAQFGGQMMYVALVRMKEDHDTGFFNPQGLLFSWGLIIAVGSLMVMIERWATG